MAFPGGRVDPGDAGPLAAALRETDEEIGLDLDSRGALLGELPQVPVIGGGRRLPLAIHPFVFGIPDPAVSFELNHEVEEALWIPLAYLADRANRSSFVWEGRGARVHMPACDYGDRRIWGLTLRMIEDLLLVVGP
jgi:8-oxo-dGTP pyrophosphatase MutT (NUDIX family)